MFSSVLCVFSKISTCPCYLKIFLFLDMGCLSLKLISPHPLLLTLSKPGLEPQNCDLPDSASEVAGITSIFQFPHSTIPMGTEQRSLFLLGNIVPSSCIFITHLCSLLLCCGRILVTNRDFRGL